MTIEVVVSYVVRNAVLVVFLLFPPHVVRNVMLVVFANGNPMFIGLFDQPPCFKLCSRLQYVVSFLLQAAG